MTYWITAETKKGFTLIELMVGMGIAMVMLAAVTSTFISQTKIYNAQEQVNEMQQSARGAIDLMIRELKMAGYNPAEAAFDGVTYNSTQLMIQADLDGDGEISTSSADYERITYAYDSANKRITRALGAGGAQSLAENVTTFTFSYLDSAGNATTDSAAIRQVSVQITTQTSKPDPNYSSNGGYRSYAVSATITPINLAL